jgi:hypothetical protein
MMSSVKPWHLGAVLAALTVAAYLPLWNNDFIDFDDGVYITPNQRVKEGLTEQAFLWAWTNDEAPYWIPITWLSLQFDAEFFSSHSTAGSTILSPAAFHGQNLFWHVCSVLLLFHLWRRLTGRLWRSFSVAALFAVHPMHVESVAWAFERKDVLCVFFGILTLLAYLRYVESPRRNRYLAMVAAYFLSLMSKPMLITLPFVLMLIDFWPLRRLRRHASTFETTGKTAPPQIPLRRLVLEKLPMFALALVFAVITMDSRQQHGSVVPFTEISLSARFMNALTAYGCYLSSTFLPLDLAVLYPHLHEDWSLRQSLAGAAILLSVSALSVWQSNRRPWLLMGWLWFVISLLPVIGFAQGGAQAWADRFSYWPHIGLFAAVVWGLGDLVDRCRIPAPFSFAMGTLVLGSLMALTWAQVGCWRDSVTLWEHAISVTENNPKAHEHLSMCYRKQGRLAEANSQLVEAFNIQFKRGRSPSR